MQQHLGFLHYSTLLARALDHSSESSSGGRAGQASRRGSFSTGLSCVLADTSHKSGSCASGGGRANEGGSKAASRTFPPGIVTGGSACNKGGAAWACTRIAGGGAAAIEGGSKEVSRAFPRARLFTTSAAIVRTARSIF